VTARTSINPTVWNHIVGTYDGSRVRIYVNGIEGTAAPFAGPLFHGGSLLLGRLPGSGNRQNIDEVQFFNPALSSTEVQSLYIGSSPPADTAPPVRTNASPTGTLVAGTTQTTLTLSTNESATCRYGTTAGTSYAALPNVFSTTGSASHQVTVSALQNGQNYTFYVRCQDSTGNANPDDFLLAFAVASPPPADTTPPVRSNASPTGTLAAGTTQTTLTLSTNESATCRYSTTAGTSYTALPNAFATTSGVLHSVTVSALENGQSYYFYVRCQDSSGNANPNDFLLAFAVAAEPVFNQHLRGYWKFDEGTGTTVADASGNGYGGAPSSATGWTTGKVGMALAASASATVARSVAFEPSQLTFAL